MADPRLDDPNGRALSLITLLGLRPVRRKFTLPEMKGITVKLSDSTLERLRREARVTGRSVAAIVRDCVEGESARESRTVHDLAGDLAGSVRGSRKPATNERRRFRRS